MTSKSIFLTIFSSALLISPLLVFGQYCNIDKDCTKNPLSAEGGSCCKLPPPPKIINGIEYSGFCSISCSTSGGGNGSGSGGGNGGGNSGGSNGGGNNGGGSGGGPGSGGPNWRDGGVGGGGAAFSPPNSNSETPCNNPLGKDNNRNGLINIISNEFTGASGGGGRSGPRCSRRPGSDFNGYGNCVLNLATNFNLIQSQLIKNCPITHNQRSAGLPLCSCTVNSLCQNNNNQIIIEKLSKIKTLTDGLDKCANLYPNACLDTSPPPFVKPIVTTPPPPPPPPPPLPKIECKDDIVCLPYDLICIKTDKRGKPIKEPWYCGYPRK